MLAGGSWLYRPTHLGTIVDMVRRRVSRTVLLVAAALAAVSCGANSSSFGQSMSPEGTSSLKESYAVGDVGPGGGIVFFVAREPFESVGSDCATQCRYLEAAPHGWSGGDEDPNVAWSYDPNVDSGGRAEFGYGYMNTALASAQNPTAGSAIAMASSYSNNGKSDWFLPTKYELDELCKYARQQTGDDVRESCNDTGWVRDGFFFAGYWSSSEGGPQGSWYQSFDHGHFGNILKTTKARVRPVRAF